MTTHDSIYSFPIGEREKTSVLIWFPREVIEWERDCPGVLRTYLYLNLMATLNFFVVTSTKWMCDYVGFNYGTNSAKIVKKANLILTYLHRANAILNCPQFKGIADNICIELNPQYFRAGKSKGIIFYNMSLADYELLRNYKPDAQSQYKSSFGNLLLIYADIKSRIGSRTADASEEAKATYPLGTATSFAEITTALGIGNQNTVSRACNLLRQMGLIYFDSPVRITINGTRSPRVMKTIIVEPKAADNGRNAWQWEYAATYFNYINQLTEYFESLGQTISVKTGLPSEVYLYLQSNKQRAEAVAEKAADELF